MTDLDRPNVIGIGSKKQEKSQETAKKLGFQSFSNYDVVPASPKQKGGRDTFVPKYLTSMLEEFSKLCPDAMQFGGKLATTAHDPLTGHKVLRFIEDESYLETMLNELGYFLDFRNDLELKIKWRSFFQAFRNYARPVKAASLIPSWPLKSDHLVLGPHIEPKPSDALDEFLEFFNPYTSYDRVMIKWMLGSACWSEGQGKRPVFVIAGPEDLDSTVQIGKSTLAYMIQYVFKSFGDLHAEMDVQRFVVDLMAVSHERIIRLDNVRRGFRSSVMERLLTSAYLFGHMHGRGRISVENHSTFILTANDPAVTKDFATRSATAVLAPPSLTAPFKYDKEYMEAWVDSGRGNELIGDIAYRILNPGRYPTRVAVTRNKTFERRIGHAMGPEDIGSKLLHDIGRLNDDSAIHQEFQEFVIDRASSYRIVNDELRLNPDEHRVFVLGAVMQEFFKEFYALRNERPLSARPQDVKRMCEAAGMHAKMKEVKKKTRRGWWINPKVLTGDGYAILQNLREDKFAVSTKWT